MWHSIFTALYIHIKGHNSILKTTKKTKSFVHITQANSRSQLNLTQIHTRTVFIENKFLWQSSAASSFSFFDYFTALEVLTLKSFSRVYRVCCMHTYKHIYTYILWRRSDVVSSSPVLSQPCILRKLQPRASEVISIVLEVLHKNMQHNSIRHKQCFFSFS